MNDALAQLYVVGALAYAGSRVVFYRQVKPVARPAALSPMLFFVAQFVAALLVSVIWPLMLVLDGIAWLLKRGK